MDRILYTAATKGITGNGDFSLADYRNRDEANGYQVTPKDCAASLWEWNKSLCEETDKWDWNPLHYAVKLGFRVVLRKMLGWKTSLAYTHAGNGNDWATSIHIAANEGYVNMICELSFHCPDSLETLNNNGQNALHVSISNNKLRLIIFLLNSKKSDYLIDEPDNDGNTPLHLLAASGWISVPAKLERHASTKKVLINKENQTPLDISESSTEITQLVHTYMLLC
ncbi:ankyrin repeat-containing protein like [Capsicum galapagoense]